MSEIKKCEKCGSKNLTETVAVIYRLPIRKDGEQHSSMGLPENADNYFHDMNTIGYICKDCGQIY